VGLESTGAVTWLSETVPEPDEPPPQATRNADNKQRQTIPAAVRVTRSRAKADTLEEQRTCEERCFILEYTVDRIKQSTCRLFAV
jgi:hypothetical protein